MLGYSELIFVAALIWLFKMGARVVEGRDEAELGRTVFEDMKAKKEILPSTSPEVQEILGRFSAVESFRFGAKEVAIMQSKAINAMALPGGVVILSSALNDALACGDVSRDELAAVLAHEIGHVELSHSKSRMLRDYWEQKAKSGLQILGKLSPLAKASFGAGALAVERAQQRQEEKEADIYAIDLLDKTGFDPEALLSMLRKCHAGQPTLPEWTSLLSSHPHLQERVESVRAHMGKIAQNSQPEEGSGGSRLEGLPPGES